MRSAWSFSSRLALSALRISIPGVIPVFELLLFGWLGVALGRLTLGGAAARPSSANAEEAAKSDRIDAILRSIAKLLLTQDERQRRLHRTPERRQLAPDAARWTPARFAKS